MWLNSGVAVKRFDHVSFTEVLDMSPYVYCKCSAHKQRPKTLDIDPATRLVGGRNNVVSGSQRSMTYVSLAVCVCIVFLAAAGYPDRPNFGLPPKIHRKQYGRRKRRRNLESRSAAEKNPAKFGSV